MDRTVNQKIVTDMQVLLREAGYSAIEVQGDAAHAVVSARRERGGVCIQVLEQLPSAIAAVLEEGGAVINEVPPDPYIVPEIPGLREQIRANPALAEAMGIAPERLQYLD